MSRPLSDSSEYSVSYARESHGDEPPSYVTLFPSGRRSPSPPSYEIVCQELCPLHASQSVFEHIELLPISNGESRSHNDVTASDVGLEDSYTGRAALLRDTATTEVSASANDISSRIDGLNVTAGPAVVTVPEQPRTYMMVALVSCLCFNPLIGLGAVLLSATSESSYSRGEINEARQYGRLALGVAVVGFLTTFLGLGILWATGSLPRLLNLGG